MLMVLQDSTLMLTPLKNNEFQVSTTNQFSYLPYQQNLHNYNKQPPGPGPRQLPFARSNKLRQNFNKREQKPHPGPRPKSVDFEVRSCIKWTPMQGLEWKTSSSDCGLQDQSANKFLHPDRTIL